MAFVSSDAPEQRASRTLRYLSFEQHTFVQSTTAAMNAPPTPSKPQAMAPPTFKPIEILAGQSSFSYAHLHPVLLLSLLLLSFQRLVADPIKTLLSLAPPLVVLQALYCVVCLPSSGKAVPEASSRPGMKKGKTAKGGVDWWSRIVVRYNSVILFAIPSFKGQEAEEEEEEGKNREESRRMPERC